MYRIRQCTERERRRTVSLHGIERILVSRVGSRECDCGAVRRPHRFRVEARGEPDRISAVSIYDPDSRNVVALTRKRDFLSVGRPIWIVVSQRAVRYASTIGAIRVDTEQLHHSVDRAEEYQPTSVW